jgi:hypothetical protein
MKTIPAVAVLCALGVSLAAPVAQAGGAAEDGVALAIIYDTSGSMREPVQDENGKAAAKYIVANRALISIAHQIQTFATNSTGGAPRKLQVGLFIFSNDGAREMVKFGPFDPAALESFAKTFATPSGSTPLGNALSAASRPVLDSPLTHKHILVITDGINTAGPSPAAVLPRLKQQAAQKEMSLSVHFVAFDVDAKVFDPVKKQGATVVSAANEAQLNSQLEFILQRKILLEEEEKK